MQSHVGRCSVIETQIVRTATVVARSGTEADRSAGVTSDRPKQHSLKSPVR